jgi:hypothetical protein
MKHAIAIPALLLSLAASAAGPKTNLVDHSAAALIDAAQAKSVMAGIIPAKVWKVYPASKYAFVSQVEGGMTAANTCVVSARVMLLPLTPTMKAVLFRPEKTATAFDAVANASAEQCKALARDKLKEATTAVVSALVKS